jgi:hypothetical protein
MFEPFIELPLTENHGEVSRMTAQGIRYITDPCSILAVESDYGEIYLLGTYDCFV